MAEEERVAAREATSATIRHVERKNPGYLRSPPSEVSLDVLLSSMKLFLVNVITPSSGLKNLSLKRIVHVTKLKSPLVQI